MIRRTITALAGAILATTLFAAAASADTLAGRAAPFTPAQAPGDQYTTPDAPAPPPQVGGEVTPTSTPSRERGNPDAEEVAGERATGDQVAAQAEPGGQVGARVEPGVTAPKARGGSLPFTGSDLGTLVWIALALVAAGLVVEVARRRLAATA
jgi:hypothetical protein